MEKQKFRRKFLLELVTHHFTLYPFLGGAMMLMGSWTFGFHNGYAMLLGLAGILGGIGNLLHRFLVGDEKIARKVLEEIEKESQEEKKARLDSLAEELSQDDTLRNDKLFRELRALDDRFQALDTFESSSLNIEISLKIRELFDGCITSLKDTLELWKTAQAVSNKKSRAAILKKRDTVLDEVEKSITHTEKILLGLESIESHDDSLLKLSEIRSELDENLEVAKRTEERMKELGREFGVRE